MKNFFFSTLLFLSPTFLMAQNYSLKFDGVDDYVQHEEFPKLKNARFTVEGWINCPTSATEMSVVNIYEPGKGHSIYIEVRPEGLLRFLYRPLSGLSGGANLFSTTIVSDSKWHHFAAVYNDQNQVSLFIDGKMEAFAAGVTDKLDHISTVELGRNILAPAESFRQYNGSLDDLKIWTVARTAQEISQSYNKELSGQESGLYAYFKFDEINSANDVVDCTTSGLHGVRAGTVGSLPSFWPLVPTLNDVQCGAVSSEEIIQQSLTFFPNPATQSLQIQAVGENFEINRVEVFNLLGEIVMQTNLSNGLSQIDVSQLPPSTYLLLGHSEKQNAIYQGKFVKI